MKILLVSPLPPPGGGIATWTVKYQKYCEEHEISVSVVNNALRGSRSRQIGARRQLFSEVRRTWYVLSELKRKLREERPDIVHLNSSCSKFGIFRDFLCVLRAERSKVPVVFHCHCNIQDHLRNTAGRWAFRAMARKSAKVFTLNQKSFTYASRYAKGKTEIVPNFIEQQALSKRDELSPTIREVVFVGHVNKSKGVGEIIRVAAQLPNMRFILVGPVQAEISGIAVTPNVVFQGAQPHETVLETLRKADVFLFPSYTEGFSIALVEAMGCGLPVMTTDVGANAEMIEDRGGIIVPVGDSGAIVEALKNLSDDYLARKTMSEWNVEKVRNRYLQDCVIKKLIEFYNEILYQQS